MKSKKNAFTLIELLAIIVILAIIAVITVPIILNIIENSRKGAATDSAYGYKNAVNKAYVQELAKPNQESLKLDGTYEVQNDGTLKPADGYSFGVTNYNTLPVSVSGDKPTSGSLTYENNVLKSGTLIIGNYTATYSNGSFTTVKTGSSSSEVGNGGQGSGSSGNQTPINPYLTRFDGNYTYFTGEYDENEDGIWGSSIPNRTVHDTSVYIRNDGEIKEVCDVFGSGQAGTVCMTSSYYNSNYSETDGYESDFEDVTNSTYNITTREGLASTGLKGYSLAKAEEMLTAGASSCNVTKDYAACDYFCLNEGGEAFYYDNDCGIIYDGSGYYCYYDD